VQYCEQGGLGARCESDREKARHLAGGDADPIRGGGGQGGNKIGELYGETRPRA